MNRTILMAAALVSSAASATLADVVTRLVSPLDTDPDIVDVDLPIAGDLPRDHFIAFDPDAQDNGKLFVWLAGSGGAPIQYQAFCNTGARLGFDVIGLVYDSWPAVNIFTINSDDPDLPEAIRRERLFGEDGTALIDVDPANSVVNRLVRIIEHQAALHPGEDWDEYLLPDGTPDWSRIVVGGHSQGAGHAAYLSKEFLLAGAVIVAGPGDFVQGIGTAPWVYAPGLTPPDRMYAFTHVDDPTSAGFFFNQTVLELDSFGPPENVDGKAASELSSHMLLSTLEVDNGNYHSAVVVDAFLPLTPAGTSAYRQAWTYLFQQTGAGKPTAPERDATPPRAQDVTGRTRDQDAEKD